MRLADLVPDAHEQAGREALSDRLAPVVTAAVAAADPLQPDESLGQPIAPSRGLGLALTENFRAWFGESRLRAVDGRPLLAVHYTRSEFTQFDHQAGRTAQFKGQGYTTSFGTDYVFPQTGFFFYVGEPPPNSHGLGIAMPVYLAIERPLDLRENLSPEDATKVITWLQKEVNRKPSPGEGGYTLRGNSIGGLRQAKKNGLAPAQLWTLLEENSFTSRGATWDALLDVLDRDGLVFEGNSSGTCLLEPRRGSGDGKTYLIAVARRPNQIKSATANSGSFDPGNPDIQG